MAVRGYHQSTILPKQVLLRGSLSGTTIWPFLILFLSFKASAVRDVCCSCCSSFISPAFRSWGLIFPGETTTILWSSCLSKTDSLLPLCPYRCDHMTLNNQDRSAQPGGIDEEMYTAPRAIEINSRPLLGCWKQRIYLSLGIAEGIRIILQLLVVILTSQGRVCLRMKPTERKVKAKDVVTQIEILWFLLSPMVQAYLKAGFIVDSSINEPMSSLFFLN